MTYNNKENLKKQDKTPALVFIIFMFFATTLSIGVVRLSSQYFKQKAILKEKKRKLQKLQEKTALLKFKIKQTSSKEYIEAQARKLALAKPDELVVIGSFPTPTPLSKKIIKKTPVYMQWYNIFLNNE